MPRTTALGGAFCGTASRRVDVYPPYRDFLRSYHVPCAALAGCHVDVARALAKTGALFCPSHRGLPEASAAVPAAQPPPGSAAAQQARNPSAWLRSLADLRAEVAGNDELRAALRSLAATSNADPAAAALSERAAGFGHGPHGGLVAAQADRDRLVSAALVAADGRGVRCGVCSTAFLPSAVDAFAPEPRALTCTLLATGDGAAAAARGAVDGASLALCDSELLTPAQCQWLQRWHAPAMPTATAALLPHDALTMTADALAAAAAAAAAERVRLERVVAASQRPGDDGVEEIIDADNDDETAAAAAASARDGSGRGRRAVASRKAAPAAAVVMASASHPPGSSTPPPSSPAVQLEALEPDTGLALGGLALRRAQAAASVDDDDGAWWLSSVALRCGSCRCIVHAGCYGVPPSVVVAHLLAVSALTSGSGGPAGAHWICESCSEGDVSRGGAGAAAAEVPRRQCALCPHGPVVPLPPQATRDAGIVPHTAPRDSLFRGNLVAPQAPALGSVRAHSLARAAQPMRRVALVTTAADRPGAGDVGWAHAACASWLPPARAVRKGSLPVAVLALPDSDVCAAPTGTAAPPAPTGTGSAVVHAPAAPRAPPLLLVSGEAAAGLLQGAPSTPASSVCAICGSGEGALLTLYTAGSGGAAPSIVDAGAAVHASCAVEAQLYVELLDATPGPLIRSRAAAAAVGPVAVYAASSAPSVAYCVCGEPFDRFVVECESCKEWFHGSCLGLDDAALAGTQAYICGYW